MNTSRKFETLPAELQVRSRTSRTVDVLCIDLGASFTIVFCVNRTLWKWAVHTAQVYIAVLQKTCPVPTPGLFFFLRLFNHFRWRKQWQPTPVLLPEKSHGRRSLVGCSPWGLKESDTTERLHFHFSLSRTGEGNGNPLQCSCLENPRDGGVWWAAVYGVAQSQTQLKWLSSSNHFSRNEDGVRCIWRSIPAQHLECLSIFCNYSTIHCPSQSYLLKLTSPFT